MERHQPLPAVAMNHPYVRIERAIDFIRQHAERQPRLAEIAAVAGLSPFHFQRMFRAWAGISPKRYLEFVTVARAKALLTEPCSVLDATHAVGLSSPSRLHEQFVSLEAASPGEFKSGGAGLHIGYGIHSGPFGPMLVARSPRGVCMLSFLGSASAAPELTRLQRLYPNARLSAAADDTAHIVQHIFAGAEAGQQRFQLLVHGTNLQVQVWRALLRIPVGATVAYSELARDLGRPRAVRAVASAVAANPVNYLIPCHRVLRANGHLGEFRGGPAAKAQLLLSELGRPEREPY